MGEDFPLPDGNRHPDSVRNFRARIWWEGVKRETVRSRTIAEQSQTASTGRRFVSPIGGDVVALVYGWDWRQLNNHSSEAMWLANLNQFVNAACSLWDLPLLQAKEMESNTTEDLSPASECRKVMPRSLDHVPDCLPSNAHFEWQSSCKQFIFVVDCQPVQRVVCGHYPLRACELANVYTQVADNLAHLFNIGWSPPVDWGDSVI